MTEIDYKGIFRDALEKGSAAGFQNIGDMEDACKFAEKEKYDVKADQEVRNLISKKDGVVWIMFVLELKNKKDIVVFHKGTVKDVRYGMVSLITKPIKIIELY